MKLKGLYAGKPAMFQLLLLITCMLFGTILMSTINMGYLSLQGGEMTPATIRVIQLGAAIGSFLFPALVVAWLCSMDPAAYLSLKQKTEGKTLLLVLISMLLLSPTNSLALLLNKQMDLPAFMEPVEHWMKAAEAQAELLTNKLLTEEGLLPLIGNLVVVAVLAGITEEFLFRGALQRIVARWTSNHHLTIWSVAALFSAFHLQFYGFLPRLLLGAYFGYLLYWSRNIWIPVFAHFANNAIAVIGMSNPRLRKSEFISGEISEANLLPYSALAIVTLVLFFLCIQRIQKEFSRL